jgi:hypothetical protein
MRVKMGQILYPNDMSYKGPWLIDLNSLEKLDEIVNQEWTKVKEHNEAKINEEIERKLKALPENVQDQKRPLIEKEVRNSYMYKSDTGKLTIKLKSGNKIVAPSFREASREPGVTNETPVGFVLELRSGEAKAKIAMNEYSRDDLSLSVDSPEPSVTRDFFFQIDRWVKCYKPPLWVKIWKSIQWIHWYLMVFAASVYLLFVPTGSDTYKKALTAEAHKIIENGIDSTESNRALEILLSLQTNYVPENVGMGKLISKTTIVIFSVALFICIILSFAPKSYLGFGKGEKKVRFWKIWLRLISFTIPSSILLPILIDKLSAFF